MIRIEAAAIALILGFCLDLMIGDPPSLWHPAQGIGYLIKRVYRWLRKRLGKSRAGQLAGGVLLVVFVSLLALLLPAVLLFISYRIHFFLGLAVETLFCWWLVAARSLKDQSMLVYEALRQYGLEAGRRAVSRNMESATEELDEEGVIRTTVEMVAENTVGAVVAPVFFVAWGGALFGFFYQVVQNMGSMVHKNPKYRCLWKPAACLDVICNYIPARIAALLMIASSGILRMDMKNAFRIFRRDRHCGAGLNAGQVESVAAGALQIQLGGSAFNSGILQGNVIIGDSIRTIDENDIVRVNELMYLTSILSLMLLAGLRLLAAYIWEVLL